MFKYLLVSLVLVLSFTANAKTIWSNYSFSYLSGSNYEVGDSSRNVMTFEYATGTTWGDSFMFFDRLISDNGHVETYGEFSPRFKISDLDGFVKSIYFAPSIEMGPSTNYLYGIGTDLAVPGFAFFQANGFFRDNANGDSSFQATLVWAIPLGPLWYDGFLDYATGFDADAGYKVESSMNLTSQLKYDIAQHIGADTKVFVGVEYTYWINKFGIDGVDENNLNLLVKYHF